MDGLKTSPEDPEGGTAELLHSIVGVARAIFGAAASSIFLLEDDELVFQAVAGVGQDLLIGTTFPADRGIAGWVAQSGESIIVDELRTNPVFAADIAESTGYLPTSLMAAPLLRGGRTLGVLEVLDPAPQSRSDLRELELLSLFAEQAALGLELALDRRPAATATGRTPESSDELVGAQLVAALRSVLAAAGP